MANVVVIGAGVVGAATAIELQRDGHRVTILEPGEPGGEQAASYGNGTLLNPSSILPMSSPGIWRKVPGWLADPLGPLAIRWRYLPRLLPWLTRFLRAGATEARVAATARALRPLLLNAPELHRRLAEEAGVSELISRQGMLSVFPSRAEFVAEELEWRLRRENGVRWLELSADELRQREPTLSRRYSFGVLVEENGQCRDPGAYVAALVRHAVAQGAELRRARALGFRIEGARLLAVRTDAGEIAADRAVIAAGARSHVLAAAAGDRVPLETERGYHAVIADPGIAPRYPVMPSDGKMACVMTPQGLRLAGQVELAGLDAAPNWRRAEVLRDFARRVFPDVPADLPASRVKVWMGHRPSTPDGLPCIGPASGCPDIVHAFGHGHVGLTAGAATGRLVADLISGRQPAIDIAPFAAQRF
ncbi:MAG TPA: FAD-dependent oxidoreductase [Acetobacteraceae bacterium]|jgi:D-amino-acid dehydrogenase|nr:FAD-dependent oxidoreductase [Acetobacteraceae bacterium]